MINYPRNFYPAVCIMAILSLTACDSSKNEGAKKEELSAKKEDSLSTLVHPRTQKSKEDGERFAKQVSKAWNIKTEENKLTLKKETTLTNSQVENGIKFETEAKCTKDGGAEFLVTLYENKSEGGEIPGAKPHKMNLLFNDLNPIEADPSQSARDFSNRIEIGKIYYGLANWKIDPKLAELVENHKLKIQLATAAAATAGLEVNSVLREEVPGLAELMTKNGINDLQWNRDFDDELYRVSIEFMTNKGKAVYHLPTYNRDVREYLRLCSKDENQKKAIYSKVLDPISAKNNELDKALSASTTTPPPTTSASSEPAIAAPSASSSIKPEEQPAPALPATPASSEQSSLTSPVKDVVQPSFDCAKASTVAEKLICADTSLAKLDRELSESYKFAREKTKDKDKLKTEQRAWVKLVGECKDATCVSQAYKIRLSQLTDIP